MGERSPSVAEVPVHRRLLTETAQRLSAVTTSPRDEAGRLLAHALGLEGRADLTRLIASLGRTEIDRRLTPEVQERFAALVATRVAGVPLQYVLGRAEFYESRLLVRPGVFIPRPETEMLVDAVRGALTPGSSRVLDVGTGSGAIVVSVLLAYPDAVGVGVDVSPDARRVTEENAHRLGVADRLTVIESDGFGAVPPGAFDVIVSNPPYVATSDPLPPDVRDHEPHAALYAGADGLDVIRHLVDGAQARLVPGGHLVLEIGEMQGERVYALLVAGGFANVTIERDLSGRERMARGVRPAR